MLKATIEIWPYGWEDNKRTLATVEIGLKHIDRETNIGHYMSRIETDQRGPQPPRTSVRLTHDRNLGAVELVSRALIEHQKAPEGLRERRAAGGFLVHLVDTDGEALCGYKPGGTTRMGIKRKGWVSTDSAPHTRPCEKCQKKLSEMV